MGCMDKIDMDFSTMEVAVRFFMHTIFPRHALAGWELGWVRQGAQGRFKER